MKGPNTRLASVRAPVQGGMKQQVLLIDVYEVATLLGISKSMVYKRLAAGGLPPVVKLGRCTRWNRAEIERFVEEGCPSRSRWKAIQSTRAKSAGAKP